MKWLDRKLRDLRIEQALPFIRPGDRLLDIGCFDQTLINLVASRVKLAVGVDPLVTPRQQGNVRILQGTVPGELSLPSQSFDVITMLAVLEHIPDTLAVASECQRLLAPGGRAVITVPKPAVDHVLKVLSSLRLIKGMSLEEHHGYDVNQTGPIFTKTGLHLHTSRTFELGLNCLFVFDQPPDARSS
jgi:2-polyprenyl-3-methyl-5-hydroxy-6-metoxy-1,4-benzoquinol methylase